MTSYALTNCFREGLATREKRLKQINFYSLLNRGYSQWVTLEMSSWLCSISSFAMKVQEQQFPGCSSGGNRQSKKTSQAWTASCQAAPNATLTTTTRADKNRQLHFAAMESLHSWALTASARGEKDKNTDSVTLRSLWKPKSGTADFLLTLRVHVGSQEGWREAGAWLWP